MSAIESLPQRRAIPPLTPEQRQRVLRTLDALRRPLPLRLVPTRPTARYGDRTIPTPPDLRPYVRSDRHFARVLGAIVERTAGKGLARYRYTGTRLACARRVLALAAGDGDPRTGEPSSLHAPLVAELILLLVPPVPCAVCGRPFLREFARRAHCSRACKRRAERLDLAPGVTDRRAPGDPCIRCGGPIPARRKADARYCGADCYLAADREARQRRDRAARAARVGPCAVCGGVVGPGFRRFCSTPCREESERRARRARKAATPCPRCGAGLPPGRHRYCGAVCAAAADRETHRARRIARRVEAKAATNG